MPEVKSPYLLSTGSKTLLLRLLTLSGGERDSGPLVMWRRGEGWVVARRHCSFCQALQV